ncbi:hypothetical protein A5N15_09650 [Rothia kristinae]|uniref:Uncharacterized protein n=1 Tax=Rothia kristinae TaxID=37923 RepID=A0A657ITU2_9MICC|nr:hypothetical protein A5N15_09650 [Rothia kristinae]
MPSASAQERLPLRGLPDTKLAAALAEVKEIAAVVLSPSTAAAWTDRIRPMRRSVHSPLIVLPP